MSRGEARAGKDSVREARRKRQKPEGEGISRRSGWARRMRGRRAQKGVRVGCVVHDVGAAGAGADLAQVGVCAGRARADVGPADALV